MSTAGPGPEDGAGSGAAATSFAQQYFVRNFLMLITENTGFVVAITFVGMTTVVPTFVSQLGGSAFLVGLVAACQTAGWMLPQLAGARIVAGKPRMAPYMLAPLYVGRPAFLLVGIVVLLVGSRANALILVILYAALLLFFSTDGLSSVPWYEFIGKTIPAERRGRMFGIAQVAGGLAGIGVGWLIAVISGSRALPFPANYGVLFSISGGLFILNVVPFLFVKEPVDGLAVKAPPPTTSGGFLRTVTGILRGDANFLRAVGSRLLYGTAIGTFPFYILLMNRKLAIGAEGLGLFTSSQVLGTLTGGLVIGWIADRFGTTRVIRLGSLVAALIPVVGLLLVAMPAAEAGRGIVGALGTNPLIYFAVLIFFLMGFAGPVALIGFASYVLEAAPLSDRSTYMGLFNALSGVLMVVSPLAGWLLGATSFALLFAVSLVIGIASFVVSLGLAEPPRSRRYRRARR